MIGVLVTHNSKLSYWSTATFVRKPPFGTIETANWRDLCGVSEQHGGRWASSSSGLLLYTVVPSQRSTDSLPCHMCSRVVACCESALSSPSAVHQPGGAGGLFAGVATTIPALLHSSCCWLPVRMMNLFRFSVSNVFGIRL